MEATPPVPAPIPSSDPIALHEAGKQLRLLAAQQLRELDQAASEIRKQYDALRTEREQLQEQRAAMRRQWEARWHEEWRRIQQRERELEAERKALDQERRAANGELELQRRQLQAGWHDFLQAQQQWQAKQAAEQSLLERQQAQLADRQQGIILGERALHEERLLLESTLHAQRQELGLLDVRIQHWREKLDALRGESALLEAALCMPAPPAARPQHKDARPQSGPTASDSINAEPAVLDLVQKAVTALIDESQRLAEYHERLLDVRRTWQEAWDQALLKLAARESQVQEEIARHKPREDALAVREQELAHRLQACARQEQRLRLRETRLAQRQQMLARQRARLSNSLRQRKLLLRKRERLVDQLRHEWEQVRVQEGRRLLNARTGCEQARQAYLTSREELRRRAQELDDQERGLAQRELAVFEVEQSLVTQQHDPAAAEQLLARLRQNWERAVAKVIQSTRRRELELQRKAEQLEQFRARLMHEREELERRRTTLALSQADLETDRQRHRDSQVSLETELQRMRTEREHLLQRIRDQEAHLEQLTMQWLDPRPAPPSLGLAA